MFPCAAFPLLAACYKSFENRNYTVEMALETF
jgi:hypothetical protein